MSKKTSFNLEWADVNLNPQWGNWLRSVNQDPYKARCVLCNRTFSLSNMGRQAIKSHEQSVRHVKLVNASSSSLSMRNCFQPKGQPESGTAKKQSVATVKDTLQTVETVRVQSSSSIANFLTKESTLRAEIIWAMKLVMSHSSYNAFKDSASVFQHMFPDSEIAKTCTLGSTKMAYLISFGLSPYFHQALLSELSLSTKYVICFDEALNRISQKGQMDLVIRYWSKTSNQVCTRYLNSVFLGHATANDLIEKFYEGIAELNTGKLLQISMDGPYVNLKFLRNLKEHLLEEKACELLDLGTCGLHVIHGAFRTGHKSTGWDLSSIFKAMHQLFKDSPARRADYIEITGSNVFPLKFCQVRWLENISVAERAIEVYANVKKYVGKTTLSKTATIEIIERTCHDKLILAKIAFFSSVSSILCPFLTSFQSADPMAPFLYDAVYSLVRLLMRRFIKKELMGEATTPEKCLKIDPSNKTNLCKIADVDIGIAASVYLAKCGASDLQKREFRNECQIFLQQTTCKILQRSPLSFPLVKFISCLNPKLIFSNAILCEKRMGNLLQILHEKQHVTSIAADRAKMQFSILCH